MRFLKFLLFAVMLLSSILMVTIIIGLVVNDSENQNEVISTQSIEELRNSSLIDTKETAGMDSPLRFSVNPATSNPGDTILVKANKPGTVTFLGKSYLLKEFEDSFITLIPISMDQPLGQFRLDWSSKDKETLENDNTGKEVTSIPLLISEKKFSTQYLEVTKQQEEMTRNEEKINEDRKKFYNALANPIENPLFSGSFVQPLEGRVSTMFGYTRYVNGKLSSRHLAMDIAAPEGTPIVAPNNGKVVLAEKLYLSGNRVIIDHGCNLQTSFSHMSKLNVNVGDLVKKGDIIGWVGSTGFSTGPHLHHAVYVHGYAVNPEQFFGADPTEWK